MLAGVILVIAGFIFKPLFVLLASVGALLFVAGYIAYFARSRNQPYEKRWRGEVVKYPDTWSSRIRRLFGRRR